MIYPTIIGITGRKYNGKDTVADYLVKHHGYIKISFADPLKEACQSLFGFTHRQVYGDLKETIDSKWNITPRTALQFVGTDLIRDNIGKIVPSVGENFWVFRTFLMMEDELRRTPDARFVIPDVRFPNEIECLKKCPVSVCIIRVKRPCISENHNSLHTSESMIDSLPVDFEILNDSCIKSLCQKVYLTLYLM